MLAEMNDDMTEMTLFRDRDVTILMMGRANAEIHLLPFEADSAALRDCERRVV